MNPLHPTRQQTRLSAQHQGRGGMVSKPSRSERDAAFRRFVDEAKARHNISEVAGLDRRVRRVRKPGEFAALCAFHGERTPSMRLNDLKGTYFCFGCGAAGDIVHYVMATQRIGFLDALRWLDASDLPLADPATRARAAKQDAAERAAAIEEARVMWGGCKPAVGTPAEVYARSRAISVELPDSIRFGRVYAWRDRDTGEIGAELPAMVCSVVDVSGELVGLQRIFLANGGRSKARMKRPKKSLGRIRGAALRLGPVAPEIILCEGPEDGLTLAQEMPGRSVWVVLGTGMMPEIELPDAVSSVVIAGQNDQAGRSAAEAAAEALACRGLNVRTIYPDARYKDWNDQLRGVTL